MYTNELFKIYGRKPNFMQDLWTKTIVYPKFKIAVVV